MEIENVIDIEVESVDEIEADNVADLEVEVVESGPPGDPGIQGPPGLSAYEIYLTHGGTLSEEEWLESLKGETGDTGADGKDGINGIDGKDGEDGYTPVKGKDYFTEEDIASLKIPTKTSDLENDSGFITEDDITVGTPVITIKSIAGPGTNGSSPTTWFSDTEVCEALSKHINGSIGNAVNPINIVYGNNLEYYSTFHSLSNTIVKSGINNHYMTSYVENSKDYATVLNTNGIHQRTLSTLFIQGEWVDNVYTCTSYSIYRRVTSFIDGYYISENTLTKTNTKQYEPTKDYHPATKKYVDDAIANIDVGGESAPIAMYDVYSSIKPKDWYITLYGNAFNKDLSSDTLLMESMKGFIEYLKTLIDNDVKSLPLLKINFTTDPALWRDGEQPVYDIFTIQNGETEYDSIFSKDRRPAFMAFYSIIHSINQDSDGTYRKRFMCMMTWDENDNPTITGVRVTGTYKTYTTSTTVDNKITTALANYATEAYVDDAIANIDVGGGGSSEPVKTSVIYEINVNTNTTPRSGYQDYNGRGQYSTFSLDSDALTSIAEQFTNAYADGYDLFSVNLSFGGSMSMRMFSINTGGNTTPYEQMIQKKPTSICLSSGHIPDTTDSVDKFKIGFLSLTLSWSSDGVCSCNGSSGKIFYMVSPITVHNMNSKLSSYGYLTTTNTSAYEPTADYHPAHKKYVDEAIASAITSVLEAEY